VVSAGVSENPAALKPYSRYLITVLSASGFETAGEVARLNREFHILAIAFTDVVALAPAPVLSPAGAIAPAAAST
jgi:hypothetical protein